MFLLILIELKYARQGVSKSKNLYETAITRGGKGAQKYLTTELEVLRQTTDALKNYERPFADVSIGKLLQVLAALDECSEALLDALRATTLKVSVVAICVRKGRNSTCCFICLVVFGKTSGTQPVPVASLEVCSGSPGRSG